MAASESMRDDAGARHIDVTDAGIHVDGVLIESLTVEALARLFGAPRIVPPDDPAPDDRGRLPNTIMVWDEAGVRAFTRDRVNVGEVSIQIARDPERDDRLADKVRRFHAAGVFSGAFTVAGEEPLAAIAPDDLRSAYRFLETSVGDWEITLQLNSTDCGELHRMPPAERRAKSETEELADIVRAAPHPFREVSINSRSPRKSSGKWQLPAAAEPVLQIASLPLRLAVIDELMYRQGVLEPRFDVHDFAQDQGEASFDPFGFGAGIIPAVRDWFARLPVPARLAGRIETLLLDGGNDIYLQLAPQWDGEDDSFQITTLTAEDLALFPHLREVDDIGGFLSDHARKALEAHGIMVS